ncbi:LOW QUALITY PROTEIN: hypothetical protein U9M48_034481 [Paspalum notatum var. saurae]|uniref:Retrotransposon gag domain-containing protein n=1 Tax=Paspalum notatum var. saurae TaxID=547442 RepID=A0AAQ3X729_PASNO
MTNAVHALRQAQAQPPPPPPRDRRGDFRRVIHQPSLMPRSHRKPMIGFARWNADWTLLNAMTGRGFCMVPLRGAAPDWWESYGPQDRDAFTWAQFGENFRNHHVPAGLMKMKKKEFLSPKRGQHLARYATAEVAEDGEKQEYFLEGPNDELQYHSMNHTFPSFHQPVDGALFTERKRREIEERKRKYNNSSSSSNTRPRFSRGPSSRRAAGSRTARLPVPAAATGVAGSPYASGSAPSADHSSHHEPDYGCWALLQVWWSGPLC